MRNIDTYLVVSKRKTGTDSPKRKREIRSRKPLILLMVAMSIGQGCATPPIIVTNVPEAHIAECQSIAERRDDAGNLAEHAAAQGVARGILGRAVEAAVTSTSLSLKILSYKAVGSFAAGSLAWPLALLGIGEGVASGLHENARERERITRECLRDRGHRVY